MNDLKFGSVGAGTAVALILLAAPNLACGPNGDDRGPHKAQDWGDVMLAQGAVVSLLYEGAVTTDTAEDAASSARDFVLSAFTSCAAAVVQEDGVSVRYTFDACDDLPFGISGDLAGEVEVRYGMVPDPGGGWRNGRVTLDMQSTSHLRIGTTSFKLEGSARNHSRRAYWATSTSDSPWADMNLELQVDATGPHGHQWVASDMHQQRFIYDHPTGQLTASASSINTQVDGEDVGVEASYTRVNMSCPEGTVSVSKLAKGESDFSVFFDGTTTAEVQPRAYFDPLKMDCTSMP